MKKSFSFFRSKPYDGDVDLIKFFKKPYRDSRNMPVYDMCIIDLKDDWKMHAGSDGFIELQGRWEDDLSRGIITVTLSKQYESCLTLKQLRLKCIISSPITSEDDEMFRLKKASMTNNHFTTLNITESGKYI